MKTFNYTNDNGKTKMIMVNTYPSKNTKYFFSLWNRNETFDGEGYMTKEEIIDFCNHYNISVDASVFK